MKKLSLWLCPVALAALGTSARAGTYVPLGGNSTYYDATNSVPNVSARAPRLDPNNLTGPKIPEAGAANGPVESGVSQKEWAWSTRDPLNDPARSQSVRCTYRITCNVYAEATPDVYDAQGKASFRIRILNGNGGEIHNEPLEYFMDVYRGVTSYNFLPRPTEQPNTVTTQPVLSPYNRTYPYPYGEEMRIRAQSLTTVANSAAVRGRMSRDVVWGLQEMSPSRSRTSAVPTKTPALGLCKEVGMEGTG